MDREILDVLKVIQNDIGNINKRIDIVQNDISTLNKRMDTVQNDISTLNKRMDTVQNDIGTLNKRIDTMQNDINTLNKRMNTVQNDINTIDGRMDVMQNDISTMNGRMNVMEKDIKELRDRTDKNTIMLENVNRSIEILAEVQSASTEQLERAKDKDGKSIAERLDIIELSIKDTSGRVKEIQKDLSRVVRATAENWAEIVELKAVK